MYSATALMYTGAGPRAGAALPLHGPSNTRWASSPAFSFRETDFFFSLPSESSAPGAGFLRSVVLERGIASCISASGVAGPWVSGLPARANCAWSSCGPAPRPTYTKPPAAQPASAGTSATAIGAVSTTSVAGAVLVILESTKAYTRTKIGTALSHTTARSRELRYCTSHRQLYSGKKAKSGTKWSSVNAIMVRLPDPSRKRSASFGKEPLLHASSNADAMYKAVVMLVPNTDSKSSTRLTMEVRASSKRVSISLCRCRRQGAVPSHR